VKTISLDLRERILAVYDAGKSTREEVAKRFRLSLGFVKTLLSQRKRTGQIGPMHHRSGRKPKITAQQREALRELVAQKPDATLAEMKAGTGLECTPQAIHHVLKSMKLTYKKRRSGPASKTGRTSGARANAGQDGKADLTRKNWSSSTSPRRKQT
jgi:putative transposase